MLFNITREDATKLIKKCHEAFLNIIQQCIQNSNYWGGLCSLNGFTYAIAEGVFPKNGKQGPKTPGIPTTTRLSTSTVTTTGRLTRTGRRTSTSSRPVATPPFSNSHFSAATTPLSNTHPAPIYPHVGMPECFPSHGTNEADRIVSIAMTDQRISTYCAGTNPTWMQVASSGGNGDSTNNNHYDATLTLDAKARALCKMLYTEEGNSQPDVQNACTGPFKAIREACPFNGGQVKADCGVWTLQSCPLGGRCKVGEPGKHCKTDSGNTKCL